MLMKKELETLQKRLKDEQRRLLAAASIQPGLPSNSILEKVAQLELNIAAIENTLAEGL
jgi:hypothetical protein